MTTTSTSKSRSEIWWVIPGILIAALIWYFLPPSSQVFPPTLKQATLLTDSRTVEPFTLEDADGNPFTLDNLRGRWSMLFFGYTHCPDVCPTTLQMIATTLRRLQAEYPESDIPQVVFISVDPERDTKDRLKQFTGYFNENFIGVTGDAKQIDKLARQLGIIYAKVKDSPGGDYLVDHSAAIILFDPGAHFRALFGVPHNPDNIASDLQAIEHYYRARYR